MLGLPFAFASHFAPDYLIEALEIYRSKFRPSEALQEAIRHAVHKRLRGRDGGGSQTVVRVRPAASSTCVLITGTPAAACRYYGRTLVRI